MYGENDFRLFFKYNLATFNLYLNSVEVIISCAVGLPAKLKF